MHMPTPKNVQPNISPPIPPRRSPTPSPNPANSPPKNNNLPGPNLWASQSPKKSKEDNLRNLARTNEDLKRQNAELQSALIRMAPPPVREKPVPQEEVDELADLADDDFVSVSQVKKLAERIVKATVKSAMNEGRVEKIEKSFKNQHSDYEEVVNQENFEKLFKDMPEMKPVLSRAYELAVKGEDIDPVALSYKLLKQYSTTNGEEQMNKKSPSEEKLSRNQAKPISANAIKSSALTEAHKYMGGNAPRSRR